MTDWKTLAEDCGFDAVTELDVSTLKTETWVRDTCAADKCHAYDKNWTCPPACGTLEECAEQMEKYENGLLLQVVGHLKTSIDAKCYLETGERLQKSLEQFSDKIRETYPDALVLGAGGCRICKKCAYPEPCRFPGRSISSMEAYGLFVSRVCKDNGAEYYHGPKTITYTGCILY